MLKKSSLYLMSLSITLSFLFDSSTVESNLIYNSKYSFRSSSCFLRSLTSANSRSSIRLRSSFSFDATALEFRLKCFDSNRRLAFLGNDMRFGLICISSYDDESALRSFFKKWLSRSWSSSSNSIIAVMNSFFRSLDRITEKTSSTLRMMLYYL